MPWPSRKWASSISSLTMVFAFTMRVAPRRCMIASTCRQAASASTAQCTCAPPACSRSSARVSRVSRLSIACCLISPASRRSPSGSANSPKSIFVRFSWVSFVLW